MDILAAVYTRNSFTLKPERPSTFPVPFLISCPGSLSHLVPLSPVPVPAGVEDQLVDIQTEQMERLHLTKKQE